MKSKDESASLTVDATEDTLWDLNNAPVWRGVYLALMIHNSGLSPLASLKLQCCFSDDDDDWFDITTNWSLSNLVRFVAGSPNSLAAGVRAHAIIHLPIASRIRLRGSSVVGTTLNVKAKWTIDEA